MKIWWIMTVLYLLEFIAHIYYTGKGGREQERFSAESCAFIALIDAILVIWGLSVLL